jgi:NADH:ubiquinone oxidoreductase subunit 6 (subunit J)
MTGRAGEATPAGTLVWPMILKIIAFISAAIPLFLFLRAMFGSRPVRENARMKEFKKQLNLAVTIFLVLIACLVAWAAARLIWTWL